MSVLLELCLCILKRAKCKCLFEYDHDLEADRRRIKDSGIDTKLDLFINIPDDLPERRKSITIAGYVTSFDLLHILGNPYNLRCSETCPLGGIRWDAKKKPKKSTLKSPIELKTDNPPETLNIDESEEQNDFLLTPT